MATASAPERVGLGCRRVARARRGPGVVRERVSILLVYQAGITHSHTCAPPCHVCVASGVCAHTHVRTCRISEKRTFTTAAGRVREFWRARSRFGDAGRFPA